MILREAEKIWVKPLEERSVMMKTHKTRKDQLQTPRTMKSRWKEVRKQEVKGTLKDKIVASKWMVETNSRPQTAKDKMPMAKNTGKKMFLMMNKELLRPRLPQKKEYLNMKSVVMTNARLR